MACYIGATAIKNCQRLINIPLRCLTTAGMKTSNGRQTEIHNSLIYSGKTCSDQIETHDKRNVKYSSGQRISEEINPSELLSQHSWMIERTNPNIECPTKSKPFMEILDIVNNVTAYDCPDNSKNDIDFILPTLHFFNNLSIDRECPGIQKPELLARQRVRKVYRIKEIKRRRMKKHRRRKIKKAIGILFKKNKIRRRTKQEAGIQARLLEIHNEGAVYDPLAVIKEEIKLARRGGFRIDVFGDMKNAK